MKLSKLIFNNSDILGPNYENLGKTQGSWYGKKVFLAYDSKKKFYLVQLNLFQRILRRVFGFYASTQLELVCTALERFKLSKFKLKPEQLAQYAAFDAKMKGLWAKTYPQKKISPLANWSTVMLGNVSSLKEAELICLADLHTDTDFSRVIGDIINENYQPGDKIGLEGAKAGKVIKNRSGREHQLKYVNPEFTVEGVEPQNYKEFNDPLFGKVDQKHEELIQILKDFEQEIPKGTNFTDEQIIALEAKYEALLNNVKPLFDFFFVDSKESEAEFLKATNGVKNIFQAIKDRKFKEVDKVLRLILYGVIGVPLEKRVHKARYHYADDNDIREKGGIERNKSLCEEIEKGCNGSRKMFVVMGALHILKNKKFTTEEVQSVLRKHKFVIVVPRRLMKSYGIGELNSDLQVIKQ